MDRKNGNLPNLKIEKPITPQLARVRTFESIGRVPSSPSLNINRPAYNLSQFNEEFIQIPTKPSEKIEKFKPDVSKKAWVRRLRSLFPITLWLPEYNFKENLWADILVGITIAIFQVPQSMGYCLIAQVPPVYGLYSSFFPALFYTIFGTGMHCAFGPFAIVSGVMTGAIVVEIMNELGKDPSLSAKMFQTLSESEIVETFSTTIAPTTIGPSDDKFENLKNIDIAIMVAIIIGLYILGCGVFQLGFISNFMSEELISGFTTSACVIVFFSQIRYLLGVHLSYYSGPFNLIKGIIEVFGRLGEVNMTTLKISGVCISILLIFKLVVNRLTAKCIKTPFPIELCVVIGGTLYSNYYQLNELHGVNIVGTIGNKFPEPLVPRHAIDLFQMMWSKCIATAIVGYTITLSVCKIYGKKHGYKTDANQEMIAMGTTNILSAFFQCIPAAASLPRSALQETAGGKTQVVSIVNCCCIVVVILALGKYLEQLPVCVLGSCIAVALVSLISKMGEFVRFWKVSKLDGMIWMITFVSVLAISVDLGIYIGLLCSLLLLIYKSARTKIYLLGTFDDLDIYVPINKYNKAQEPNGFKIFQMCGPLNFSNAEYFCNELENKCDINVASIRKFMKSKEYKRNVAKIKANSYEELPELKLIRLALNERLPKYVVIDCSMFSFIDFTGITTLKKTIQTYEKIGIKTVLSGVHVHLESMLTKEGFFDDIPKDYLYKSVHDAVIFLQEIDFNDENPNNDETDKQFFTNDFNTKMDSEGNSLKSITTDYSLNGDISEFLIQDMKIPRISSKLNEETPPMSRPNLKKENISLSSPALYSLPFDSINSSQTEREMRTPPSTPISDFKFEEDYLTPGSDTTEILNLSPPPMTDSRIPIPPPIPQSISTPLSAPLPPKTNLNTNKDELRNQNNSNDQASKRNIPKPPPLPPLPKESLLVPPPLPSIDYNTISRTPTVILRMNSKNQSNDENNSEFDYKIEEQSTNFFPKNNRKISSNLKSRSEMLEKFLENHKISNA